MGLVQYSLTLKRHLMEYISPAFRGRHKVVILGRFLCGLQNFSQSDYIALVQNLILDSQHADFQIKLSYDSNRKLPEHSRNTFCKFADLRLVLLKSSNFYH